MEQTLGQIKLLGWPNQTWNP